MIYRHMFVRVEYPRERGYRMESKELPDWLHLTIEKQDDSKRLFVHSRIHVDKKKAVGPSYSVKFTDQQIIREQSYRIGRYLS